MNRTFVRRLTHWILLGLAALVGLCYLAGFVRYQRNLWYMDTVAASLGATRADRIREPYRACYDLKTRCEVVGHYRTTLTIEQATAILKHPGAYVRPSPGDDGYTTLIELAGREPMRLTIGGATLDGHTQWEGGSRGRYLSRAQAPDAEVRVSERVPNQPALAFDGVPIPANILIIKVFEYKRR